jgi:NAD(P)H-flavin reductase
MVPRPARIRHLRQETADTCTLWLAPPDGRFPFAPGQFNMLYHFAVGEVPISISGDPARPEVLHHTVKVVGAVTAAIRSLGRGGVLGVRGPFGHPWPLEAARGADLVLIAGGVGLAPLRPAVRHLLRHRRRYGKVALLVGARTPHDLLYRRELARWRMAGDIQVLVTVDRADPAWSGRVGVVPALLDEVAFDPGNTLVFACGPEVMMRFTLRALERRGVTDERIYLSMERNMKCAVAFCGHCQFGPSFICKDGPVLRYDRIRTFFWPREV